MSDLSWIKALRLCLISRFGLARRKHIKNGNNYCTLSTVFPAAWVLCGRIVTNLPGLLKRPAGPEISRSVIDDWNISSNRTWSMRSLALSVLYYFGVNSVWHWAVVSFGSNHFGAWRVFNFLALSCDQSTCADNGASIVVYGQKLLEER